eukprot:jgi/Mesen1/5443/ME000271S04470
MEGVEDVEAEVEALEAISAEACTILQRYPPLIELALKPLTADDVTMQANLVVRASTQYPQEPLDVELKDVKGLDDSRRSHLLSHLRTWAAQSCPHPALVGLCEEAKEKLTAMNVPDGDCCFCMDPLVSAHGHAEAAAQQQKRPLVKLMTCFHCFHSQCWNTWWTWELQQLAQRKLDRQKASKREEKEEVLRCPVCRTPVVPEDTAGCPYVEGGPNDKANEASGNAAASGHVAAEEFLTPAELKRQAEFAARYAAQQARGGLIEARRTHADSVGIIVSSLSLSSQPELATSVGNAAGEDRTEEASQAPRTECVESLSRDDDFSRNAAATSSSRSNAQSRRTASRKGTRAPYGKQQQRYLCPQQGIDANSSPATRNKVKGWLRRTNPCQKSEQ